MHACLILTVCGKYHEEGFVPGANLVQGFLPRASGTVKHQPFGKVNWWAYSAQQLSFVYYTKVDNEL